MPTQAPERSSSQAPERGLERSPQHAPLAPAHRRATSTSRGSKSIYHSIDPEKKNKNDLPENLTSKN
jgi:hypothetical protein